MKVLDNFLRCCAPREKPRSSNSDGIAGHLNAQRTYKWEGGLKILSPREASSHRKTSGASTDESIRPSLHFLEPEEFHKALLAGWVDIALVGAGEQAPSRKTKWKRKWVAVWRDHLGWYELGREEGRVQFLPTESAVCQLPNAEGVLLCRSMQAGDATSVFISCESLEESAEWVAKIDGAITALNEEHARSKRAEAMEAARAQRELVRPRGSLWPAFSMQSLLDVLGASSGSKVVAEESSSRKSAAAEERKRKKWGGGGSLSDIFTSFGRGGGGKQPEAQSMSGHV